MDITTLTLLFNAAQSFTTKEEVASSPNGISIRLNSRPIQVTGGSESQAPTITRGRSVFEITSGNKKVLFTRPNQFVVNALT